jgi:sulfoxide reductase heme-binding subunit YedZ
MSLPAATRSRKELGTGGDRRRRLLLHHAPVALASAVVLVLFMSLPSFDTRRYVPLDMMPGGTLPRGYGERTDRDGSRRFSFTRQFTVATGYVATGLLGLTLLIGPANLLLRRRNPVSSYLRRDVGTWTAVFSAVHVVFGLQAHGGGQLSAILSYFFAPDGGPLTTSFGLGNWAGLAALVIVVLLLALSTDATLRELKAKTWKDLQRLNYTLFALVILHAFFYGALLRMTSPYTRLGVLSVIAVLVGQAVGVWLWRLRRARAAATVAGGAVGRELLGDAGRGESRDQSGSESSVVRVSATGRVSAGGATPPG